MNPTCSRSRLGLLAAFSALAACAAPAPPDILIVVIDALRADHVGAYGERAELTPFLNDFASRAHVFHRAYAPCSWTMPSVASLFTSRYQSQHGSIAFGSVLGDAEVTLAEILKERRYATAGFSANILVRPGVGFGQGFDSFEVYFDASGKERAERINREALSWLDRLRAGAPPRPPLFLYLHYMEPHEPLIPPADALEQIAARHQRSAAERGQTAALMAKWIPLERIPAIALPLVHDLYEAEVLAADAQLQALFAALDARGLLANTIVAVTADHGEEFYDHGRIGHGRTLYEEVLRVPLLVRLPGQSARVDVQDVVSLVDLAPTLLDLARIPRPASFEGHSLRRSLRESAPGRYLDAVRRLFRPAPEGSAYAELIALDRDEKGRGKPHDRAIIAGSRKLIHRVDGEPEGYDLRSDPGETAPHGLSVKDRAQLAAAMERMRSRLAHAATPAPTSPIDPDTAERMRALGYGTR